MHPDFIHFLATQTPLNTPVDKFTTTTASIAALTHLAILNVNGTDAADFLQGQTTCDIHKLNNQHPAFGAFCNAKGRTISSFIIIKQQDDAFYILLPSELLATVQKKLQRYILRAQVCLTEHTEDFIILGIYSHQPPASPYYSYPEHKHCYLSIATPENSIAYWQTALQAGYQTISHEAWLALDIQAGIPWLSKETSEEFIPQSLNLDGLNAISFTKGCYTGQEIVARTHYLGKNKRTLCHAQHNSPVSIPVGCAVIDPKNPDSKLGTIILSAQQQLLVVLKDTAHKTLSTLCLATENTPPITFTTQ